jgi:hypothetical protein
MTNYVMLNNVDHFDVKVMDNIFIEASDNKAAVLTFPTEFANIQKSYPIFLSKDPASGQYQPVVLLGIQKDENLFLQKTTDGYAWPVGYIPAVIAKGPFITGFREEANGDMEAMVYIDLANPKVQKSAGKPLFLPHGGSAPYLDYITKLLGLIQSGKEVSDTMFGMLAELDLIEPITINIDLANSDKHQLRGYYTISEEKLKNLSGDKLESLNRSGFLQGAFLMIASLTNIESLIRIKNNRL